MDNAIRQVMSGLTFMLSKATYEGVPYCVDLIARIFSQGIRMKLYE